MMASNLAIVAVLIATVTFAAAFTLPGGYVNDGNNQDEGMAILAKKLALKMFLISDNITMVSSICVTCLLIYTGSLDHDIRLHSITAMKFMWVALGGMVMTFSMGICGIGVEMQIVGYSHLWHGCLRSLHCLDDSLLANFWFY